MGKGRSFSRGGATLVVGKGVAEEAGRGVVVGDRWRGGARSEVRGDGQVAAPPLRGDKMKRRWTILLGTCGSRIKI